MRGRRLGPEVYEDFEFDNWRARARQERHVMERGLAFDPWADLLVAAVEMAKRDAEGKPKALNGEDPEKVKRDAEAFLQWARETI